jgi:hypothetical protein
MLIIPVKGIVKRIEMVEPINDYSQDVPEDAGDLYKMAKPGYCPDTYMNNDFFSLQLSHFFRGGTAGVPERFHRIEGLQLLSGLWQILSPAILK